jgi:hypothetical protein
MLTKFSAEVRAYATAVIALLLMLLVPLYGVVRRWLDGAKLLRAVTAFFALNMLIFAIIAWGGANIAFAFFVWVSIYGVMVVAQFWAFGRQLQPQERAATVSGHHGRRESGRAERCEVCATRRLAPESGGTHVRCDRGIARDACAGEPERRAVPTGSRAIVIEPSAPRRGCSVSVSCSETATCS